MSSLINHDKTVQSLPGAEAFDATEVYSSGHTALFARLEDGSLATLRAYHLGGTPQIDALIIGPSGPKEEILSGLIGVEQVKVSPTADLPDLYREAAGAGDEGQPWLPAHFVICVPVRARSGIEFQLQVKRIGAEESVENEQSSPARKVRFPRGSALDLTMDL